jgi:integrase
VGGAGGEEVEASSRADDVGWRSRVDFATRLLADGYDIPTVQELLGHSDLKTTMIDTHVLNETVEEECAALSTGDRCYATAELR